MSIEVTCTKCGAEFDMRHGCCPACGDGDDPCVCAHLMSDHDEEGCCYDCNCGDYRRVPAPRGENE